MCDIFVICVDVDFCAKEHGTEFFKCFDDGEEFFFDGCAVFLSFVELASAECKRLIVLFDDGTWLEVRGDCFDVEGLVVLQSWYLAYSCIKIAQCNYVKPFAAK